MRTKSLIVILSLVSLATMAYPIREFSGWQELTERSSDIIIACCTETPKLGVPDKNGVVRETRGPAESDMNIV